VEEFAEWFFFFFFDIPALVVEKVNFVASFVPDLVNAISAA